MWRATKRSNDGEWYSCLNGCVVILCIGLSHYYLHCLLFSYSILRSYDVHLCVCM